MSHTSNTNGTDNGGNDSSRNLLRKAVQYAGLSQQDRREWRRLLRRVDRVADPYLPPDDPIRRELESLFPPYPDFKAEESALWEA